jgi:benzoyl-CoA reductase/2-hydroxyglutaryl-CoA dehydratase subunit BcrC/BadD/HgdB
LIAELKTVPLPNRVTPLRTVRIVLAGSIIAPGNTKIIDVLDGLGVTVVGDDLCTGQRTFAGLEVKEPTLAGLAEAYLERTPCAAQLYPEQKTDKRLQNLFDLVDRHRADGVLYHTLRFCDPYTFRVEENKALLDERDIPFLQLHTDYGVNDIGQLQTRIQAQVEIIKRRKKEATHGGSQAAV